MGFPVDIVTQMSLCDWQGISYSGIGECLCYILLPGLQPGTNPTNSEEQF
jgi:hypothetical protein